MTGAFRVGDHVQLIATGQTMTVAKVCPSGGAYVTEWVGAGKLKHGEFLAEALRPAAPPDEAQRRKS